MSVAVQDSLLDFGDEPTPTALRPERVPLTHGAWVDVQRGWLAGSAALLRFYGEDEALPDRALDVCRDALNAHYLQELGEPFRTAGLCFYRDGRDSVAPHGDTIGRGSSEDTMVAIVSLGEARPLALRPRDGGSATLRYNLGHGDLIVMGGSCQRTWEHGIPKSARPTGARISVQFRPHDVR
jgi:alkylated DNA repair dioxygenase AlkB